MATRSEFKQSRVADLRKRELLTTLGVSKQVDMRTRLPSLTQGSGMGRQDRQILSVEPRTRQPLTELDKGTHSRKFKLSPMVNRDKVQDKSRTVANFGADLEKSFETKNSAFMNMYNAQRKQVTDFEQLKMILDVKKAKNL